MTAEPGSPEPQIQQRAALPYLAIACHVTEGVAAAVDGAFPELFGWLRNHGVEPSGPPFIRFLEIDQNGEPLDLEVGVPVAAGVPGDGTVRAGALPAGSWATYLHVGPYRSTTAPDLAAARAAFDGWAEKQGIVWDRRDTERGSAWRGLVEHYLVGPVEEPDHSRWETQLACLIAED